MHDAEYEVEADRARLADVRGRTSALHAFQFHAREQKFGLHLPTSTSLRYTIQGGRQGMNNPGGQLQFDQKMKDAFVEQYAITGRISETAHNLGFTHHTILAHRKKDEQFDHRIHAAYARFQDVLENEAYERAVTGWEEPVYFQGHVVGHIKKKSDTIFQSMLKRHIPAYKDKIHADVNITGGVLVVPGVAKTGEDWQNQFRPKEGDSSADDSTDEGV